MKTNKKLLLSISISLLAVGVLGTGVGFSVASFVRRRTLQDYKSEDVKISGEGVRTSPYHLLIGSWYSYDTRDGVTSDYYALLFMNGSTTDFKWTKGTLEDSGTHKYLFKFDIRFDRVQFCRVDPTKNPTTWANRDHDSDVTWNSSKELETDDGTTYTISSDGNDKDGYGNNNGSWS